MANSNQLYTACPINHFDFKTTTPIQPVEGVIRPALADKSILFSYAVPLCNWSKRD